MATQQKKLADFSCLTFDCFGTLIDWETGIYKELHALIEQLPASHPLRDDRPGILKVFNKYEHQIQVERPSELYSKVLADGYGLVAAELGVKASDEDKERFGASVGDWEPFPDTVEALQRLKKHFKLVILSNVDRKSFSRTVSEQFVGVDFDAIYTAEDIGSYKPDMRNFDYLLRHCDEELGVKRDRIIHTAHGVFHDLVPAATLGLANAWIERREGEEDLTTGDLKEYRDKVNMTWRFKTMGDMADAFEAEQRGQA